MKSFDKPFEKRPNTGSLFASKVKSTPESPDYKGDMLIDTRSIKTNPDGTALIKISGWKQTSNTTGQRYLSLKVDQWEGTKQRTIEKKVDEDDIDF
jgi:hypothetical protein